MRLAASYVGLVVSNLAFWASINMGWTPPAALNVDQKIFLALGFCSGMVVLLASLGLSSLLHCTQLPARLRKVPGTIVWLTAAMLFVNFVDLTPQSTSDQLFGGIARALAYGLAAAVPVGLLSSFEQPDEGGLLQSSPARGHALVLTLIGLSTAVGFVALYAH